MILVFVMIASVAAAAPPGQDVPAARQEGPIVVTGEKNKQNKRVCKRSIATGSVMQKVTCRTAAEWSAESERSIATLERLRSEDRWREANSSEKALLPPEGRAN